MHIYVYINMYISYTGASSPQRTDRAYDACVKACQGLLTVFVYMFLRFAGPPMHSSLSTSIVHHPTYLSNMGSNPWANPVYFGEDVLKPSRQLSNPPPENGVEL